MVDTVNCDIRIQWQLQQLLLPCARLPLLNRLADLETRDSMLSELGKSKKYIAAMSRGQAMDEADKGNKQLMELRAELRVTTQVLEAYRPDVVEFATGQGKSRPSAHSRIVQIIEDQQIQCLEEAMIAEGVNVGDVIFDALLVAKCDEDRLRRGMEAGEKLVKERLGLDVKFKVEKWPEDDDDDDDDDVQDPDDDGAHSGPAAAAAGA